MFIVWIYCLLQKNRITKPRGQSKLAKNSFGQMELAKTMGHQWLKTCKNDLKYFVTPNRRIQPVQSNP